MRYEFTVPGKPQTWIRAGGSGKRYKPKKMENYQKRVQDYAFGSGAYRPIGDKQPVRLVTHLFYSDKRRRDLDNGVKTIADALQEFTYEDDFQVFELIARKYWGQQKGGAHIAVEPMRELVSLSQQLRQNELLSESIELLRAKGHTYAADRLQDLMIPTDVKGIDQ